MNLGTKKAKWNYWAILNWERKGNDLHHMLIAQCMIMLCCQKLLFQPHILVLQTHSIVIYWYCLLWDFVTPQYNVVYMGILTIKVPFFHHRTQGLCFCYLPNTKFKWNKFKWEILDNSNYDSFHGGGGFSHVYVNTHKYFVKKPKMKKMNT